MSEDTVTSGNEGAVETTREQDIAAAFDKVADATPDTGANSERVSAPVEAQAPAPALAPATEGRDALGRFSPKSGVKGPTDADTKPATPPPPLDPAGTPTPAAAAEKHPRAPASWAPAEAAHWAKATPEVREAIMRREVEVNRALQDSVQARRGLDSMQRMIQPYIGNINAAGGDALGAIKSFFDYDNRLRHGSQIEKARAVTMLIKNYGVDIGALDSELAGAPQAPGAVHQDAISAALSRELAPMREYLANQQRAEQQRAGQVQASIGSAIDSFASDPANGHFDAVRMDMADLLDIAAKHGRDLTLKEAYDQACWQNPQVRGILLQQQAASTAQTHNQAAQRARNAAVGVRSTPKIAAPASEANRSRFDDVAAAFDKHSNPAS